MNKQRKVLITTTYNEMGIIIDTKAEEVAQPEHLVKEFGDLVKDLAKDCISRQAAIDALKSQLSDWNDDYNIPVRKSIENIERLPSAQPDVPDINVGDINKFIDGLEETFSYIRERNGDDTVCGLCEFDVAYIGQSGNWCNECPGFNRDDCFKLRDKIRKKWIAEITACLPSAQFATDINVGDTVSRQAAIDTLTRLESSFRGSVLEQALKNMPPAQPERDIPKRVLWTGWKGCRDTRYKCPNCRKPVRNDDVYCHRCGQRLMFPHISFTDYIPGEKQELIVRWDDETD